MRVYSGVVVAGCLFVLSGCAAVSIAGAAVSVAATAVEVTADVAVTTGKGVLKAGEWAVDAASKESPKPVIVHAPGGAVTRTDTAATTP